MKLCLKDNPNLKWVMLTVAVTLLLYEGLEEGKVEFVGDLLVLAGGILMVLGD